MNDLNKINCQSEFIAKHAVDQQTCAFFHDRVPLRLSFCSMFVYTLKHAGAFVGFAKTYHGILYRSQQWNWDGKEAIL